MNDDSSVVRSEQQDKPPQASSGGETAGNKASAVDSQPATPSEAFPMAEVRDQRIPLSQLVRGSRMWWITLTCLLLAVVLAWWSLGETGPRIVIVFPEGHGLRLGDALRHRGIEVGQVTAVDLSPDLAGVEVVVTLLPGAGGLAREGTRFWIVRPQLSLTGVTGLETAVGAKYIGVSPGDPGAHVRQRFDGLATPPPDELDAAGVEVILRGNDSFGLNPGSPVTWRGVEVGKILSVDLSPDTRYVDVRARINASYRRLVRPHSRFWVTSGLGIDAGLRTGLRIRAESLATIARGGVAFITPAEQEPGELVPSGHVFELHPELDKSWLAAASNVGLIDFPLPPTVIIRSQWQQKQFGITRNRTRTVHGILLAQKGPASKNVRLIGPADGMFPPEEAIAGSWKVGIYSSASKDPILTVPAESAAKQLPSGLAELLLSVAAPPDVTVAWNRLRPATVPEDCCLVRSVNTSEGLSSVMRSLSRTQLAAVPQGWSVADIDRDLDDWHGATVVSTEDGTALGLFLATPDGTFVAPFPAELIPQAQ